MFKREPRSVTTDPRDDLFRAADLAGDLLETVREEDHDLTTPCAEWSVLDLVGHLVAVTRRVAHIGRGGLPGDLPTMASHAPAQGWGPAYRAGVAEMRTVWADDALLTRTVTHPAGPMPGAAAATVYVQEFATHAGDLAVAIGRTDLLEEELAETALADLVRSVPRRPDGFLVEAPPTLRPTSVSPRGSAGAEVRSGGGRGWP